MKVDWSNHQEYRARFGVVPGYAFGCYIQTYDCPLNPPGECAQGFQDEDMCEHFGGTENLDSSCCADILCALAHVHRWEQTHKKGYRRCACGRWARVVFVAPKSAANPTYRILAESTAKRLECERKKTEDE